MSKDEHAGLDGGEAILAPAWEVSPEWTAQALAWIIRQIATAGRQPAGPVALLRRYPWSLVLTLPTDKGAVFFKAVSPEAGYEARLTHALAQWEPGLSLPLLAADLERGWLLLPDGGRSLRETIRSQRSLAPWFDLLPQYAAFQQRLAARLDALKAMGVPDQGLAALPALFADLLAEQAWLRLGQEGGLSLAQFERLQRLSGQVSELVEQLASYGLPETLNQSDLNDANIFYNAGRFTLYDWGDASLGQPFFSLRVARVSLEISLDWQDFDPRGEAPMRAYLRAWAESAGLDEAALWQAYQVSQPLAAISRAAEWRRALRSVDETQRREYQHIVPALLQEFLELI